MAAEFLGLSYMKLIYFDVSVTVSCLSCRLPLIISSAVKGFMKEWLLSELMMLKPGSKVREAQMKKTKYECTEG